MLDQRNTRPYDSANFPVGSSVTNLLMGSALVYSTEDGEAKVVNSSASDDLVFAGVAWSQMDAEVYAPLVEEVNVPATAPYEVTLLRAPVDGATKSRAVASTTGALTYDAGTPSSGEYSFDGTTMQFHADEAGQTVTVYYVREITITESRALTGDGIPGASNPIRESSSVGVIMSGLVFTDQYDPSSDWTASNISDIKAGADGQFQRAGTGATVNAAVIKAPSVDSPFLGLNLRA